MRSLGGYRDKLAELLASALTREAWGGHIDESLSPGNLAGAALSLLMTGSAYSADDQSTASTHNRRTPQLPLRPLNRTLTLLALSHSFPQLVACGERRSLAWAVLVPMQLVHEQPLKWLAPALRESR